MFKNVATKIKLFAFDTTTGAPKTGDAANLTAYVSKDNGTVTALTDTSATEMDATNAPGYYLFDVAQAEANADDLLFTGKSTTANVSVVGYQAYTTPNRFSSLVIDAAGLADANAVKVGPTGAGTAQTAGDIAARLPAALVSGRIDASVGAMAANVLTAAAAASDLTTELQAGLATAAAVTAVAGDVTSVKAKTDNLPTDPADESLIIAAADSIMSRLGAPVGASLSVDLAAVKADSTAILLDTGTDGVAIAAASKTGMRLSTTGVNDVLRTALTEGYAAHGAEFTLEQALYMIWSLLAQRGISGTTLTASDLAGSEAMTFTLDSATAPTSQVRAT